MASPELVLLVGNKGGDQGTSRATQSTHLLQTQQLTDPLHSSPQGIRGNLFLEGDSSTGFKLLQQMLLSAEEAHLKGYLPTPKIFEGSNRILYGVQMMVSSFEEVTVVATKEGDQARTTQELYEQLQGELSRVRSVHKEMVAGLCDTLDTTHQQLSVAHTDLKKARDDVEFGLTREETLQRHISALESKSDSLTDEIENQMSRETAAETALAASASFLPSVS
ncbi:uncharacterized protein [Primulina eburnea]|uniref:uncharacterized protein n=1 Tax=Primulina eburnea TaxID=1245227 RepID=UPI003C6CC390